MDPAPSDSRFSSTLFPWVRSTGRFVGRGYSGKGVPTGHPRLSGAVLAPSLVLRLPSSQPCERWAPRPLHCWGPVPIRLGP